MASTVRREIVEGNEIISRIEKYARGVHDIIICSPFITKNGINPLIKIFKKKDKIDLTVISRFDELEWLSGVTDPDVFTTLFKLPKKWAVKIILVDGLHAKAIVLGKKAAIIGSANVTGGGFDGNFELGVVVRDSMVETIRKRLEKFEEAGVELSVDALEAKIDYLHGPLCQQYERLIKEARNLNRERRPGLISFTRDREAIFDYTAHLLELLIFIRDQSTPVPKDALIEWLHKKSLSDQPKMNEDRVKFIEDLGYIEKITSGFRLTERGKRLLLAENPSVLLYKKLKSKYREFERLETQLQIWAKKKAAFNANTILELEEFKAEETIKNESAIEYWNARLRWLKSLGIIEEVSKRPMKYEVSAVKGMFE